ncbi:NlpC/P60 family protein [Sedimenticola selenatireducens]|uniref:NlpC/P60 family protein n=1 Tax=Sedimenticola selenatireducens TaxID=191960 RepID=UPI0004902187|nr:NlpC/P60 family protein [Sedimenticola selenatireducens]
MRRLTLIPLLMLLTACSGVAPVTRHDPASPITSPSSAADVDQTLLDRLYRQHQEWRGTPYRIGGQSRQGIDCSGFVQLTYRSRLGVALPRTTGQQATVGQPVQQSELATGDLVFFRIDGKTRHVGIYLEQNRFLHASKSSGVMISPLDSPYWQSAYWKSRRVL